MAPTSRWRGVCVVLALFLCLAGFTGAVFQEVVRFQAFGAEFPLYWVYERGASLGTVLAWYTDLSKPWYRPTSTVMVAWIGERFFGWHDLAGWKCFFLLSLVLTACSLYWFVLEMAPRARLAALLAALFYLSHPAQDTLPLQMLPWDTLYVMFALLCAGFYWRALGAEGRASWKATAIALALFLVALTCKEMAVAIPGFLAVESAAALIARRARPGLWRAIGREILRLLPFAATVVLYLLVRLPSLRGMAAQSNTYRMAADWTWIHNNLRMLPLMSMRIFHLAGYRVEWRSYLETPLSNAGGAAILLITLAGWFLLLRQRSEVRGRGLIFLCWSAVFLLLPIYAGGQIWHVTVPLCGYGALFGLGAASLIGLLPRTMLRHAAVVACAAGLLVLGMASLKDELYRGLFTVPSMLTKDLLVHPPVPAEELGSHPRFYLEDRMNLGGWCYGCYGNLMRYIYQRVEIAESIVPPGQFAPKVYDALLKNPEAYYVVYDSSFRWHDITPEMRGTLLVTPTYVDVTTTEPMEFTATAREGGAEPVSWAIIPPIGSIDADGWYKTFEPVTTRAQGDLAVTPEIAAVAPGASARFAAGLVARKTLRLTATSTTDPALRGVAVVNLNLVDPGTVRWTVEPDDGGAITASGDYTAPASVEPRTVTIRAASTDGRAKVATSTVTLGAPWQTLDLGRVLQPGAFEPHGNVLHVRGSGDIFDKTDAFRFVYRILDGEGAVTAQVSTRVTTDFTKAGIMIRERLTEGARHAFAGIITGKSSVLEARAHPMNDTTVQFGPVGSMWLRLERKGDTFSGLTSPDGNRWEAIGSPVNVRMEQRVYAGLAVSSGGKGSSEADFKEVRVSQAAAVASGAR